MKVSTAEIYAFALDQMKVEHAGVADAVALKALFKLGNMNKPTAPVVAMDTAALTSITTRFPGLSRFRQA